MRLSLRRIALTAAFVTALAAVASLTAPSAETTAAKPAVVVRILPDDIQWNRDPSVHGLETAVLFGNPSAAAPYVQRIKFPANFRLPPHSHPNEARMVTVLSGTLYFAFGDKFDESKLKPLPPGTFFIEPKGTPHYALTKGPVVLQLNAVGPAATKYVKTPSDSPHD